MSMENVEVYEDCLIDFRCNDCEYYFSLYLGDYEQLTDKEDKL